jgi:2-succinyl-5-enolpyruvyl-6-hydroxy-3-cyclohexene-1-carboxylate synthase
VSVQATFAATLVDEWVLGGVTDAVVCPGSRSTPLALALASRSELTLHVKLDERSAAFFSIGLALSTGRPPVICTTSGTAAAELHPGVVEAHQAGVPLIVCTADRPPELHGVGASQTIDQVGLFTTSTRWAFVPGVPDLDQQASWRPLAVRALAEARNGPRGPGPVHLNLAFRDPLTGAPDALPPRRARQHAESVATVPTLMAPLTGPGLIIAGAGAARDSENVLLLAERLGWPVMADPRSGCRRPGTVAAADALARCDLPLAGTIVVLGAPWLSKALAGYVSTAADRGARVIALDPFWQFTDPTRVVTEFCHADPDDWLGAAFEAARPTDSTWRKQWQALESAAQAAIEDVLGEHGQLSEPMVARALARHAAAVDAAIMVSASMPVRDLEWYAPVLPQPPAVFFNRGANGIDGVVSTAMGIAATGRRTFALMGDLAFLHDVSGLVNLADLPCTLVVLDNGGGGIFSFLPQADALASAEFELLFGTPPTSDVGQVARGFGLPVHDVATAAEFEGALKEAAPSLVRVRVPGRTENVALHESINQAVRRALT